jgi:hypothetical protein
MLYHPADGKWQLGAKATLLGELRRQMSSDAAAVSAVNPPACRIVRSMPSGVTWTPNPPEPSQAG